MDKNTFFAEYKLSEEDLREANITWEELMRIEEEYRSLERALREIGKSFIDEYLYDILTVIVQKALPSFWKKLSANERKTLKNLRSWITQTTISL